MLQVILEEMEQWAECRWSVQSCMYNSHLVRWVL